MPERILVVDDDPSVVHLLERLLVRAGYRVTTFERPDEALSAKGPAAFDLFVIDKSLPGVGGIELIGALRRIDPDVPALLITGYPEPLLTSTVPIQGCLVKPFESVELVLEIIHRLLELRRRMLERNAEGWPPPRPSPVNRGKG